MADQLSPGLSRAPVASSPAAPDGRIRPVLLLSVLLLGGCASVLGSKDAEFSFNSSPQQAQVLVDGNPMGETPLKVKLSNTKAHTATFRKEGFQEVSCQLEKSTGAGWVILDVLMGLVPVIIDAATGNWTQTKEHECTQTLRAAQGGGDVAGKAQPARAPLADQSVPPREGPAAPTDRLPAEAQNLSGPVSPNGPVSDGAGNKEPPSKTYSPIPAPRAAADESSPSPRVQSRGVPPRTASAPLMQGSRAGRFRAELLQQKEFRMAFDDVQRLGVALDFEEKQLGLLRVMVGPGFATVSSAGYNLDHLHSAYATTIDAIRVDPVIELWKDGEKIGEVTASGVLVGPEFSTPR